MYVCVCWVVYGCMRVLMKLCRVMCSFYLFVSICRFMWMGFGVHVYLYALYTLLLRCNCLLITCGHNVLWHVNCNNLCNFDFWWFSCKSTWTIVLSSNKRKMDALWIRNKVSILPKLENVLDFYSSVYISSITPIMSCIYTWKINLKHSPRNLDYRCLFAWP
jgi:hypothetical protein